MRVCGEFISKERPMAEGNKEIRVEMRKELAGGVYANSLRITHTPEEFVLDFIMIAPPAGDVTARVITSPGHMKRILSALKDNIGKYEEKYGKIKPSVEPAQEGHIGFKP
jgi:hypothetical protein